MRFRVSGTEQRWDVEVEPGLPPVVRIDGTNVSADLQPAGAPGLYSLLIGRQSYELTISRLPDGSLAISLDGQPAVVRVDDPLSAAVHAAGDRQTAHLGIITVEAPMPGRVVAIQVQPGDSVQAGAVLVVLEAMKMESSITAPHDGTVHHVVVAPGQTVSRGAELVVLDCGQGSTEPATSRSPGTLRG